MAGSPWFGVDTDGQSGQAAVALGSRDSGHHRGHGGEARADSVIGEPDRNWAGTSASVGADLVVDGPVAATFSDVPLDGWIAAQTHRRCPVRRTGDPMPDLNLPGAIGSPMDAHDYLVPDAQAHRPWHGVAGPKIAGTSVGIVRVGPPRAAWRGGQVAAACARLQRQRHMVVVQLKYDRSGPDVLEVKLSGCNPPELAGAGCPPVRDVEHVAVVAGCPKFQSPP